MIFESYCDSSVRCSHILYLSIYRLIIVLSITTINTFILPEYKLRIMWSFEVARQWRVSLAFRTNFRFLCVIYALYTFLYLFFFKLHILRRYYYCYYKIQYEEILLLGSPSWTMFAIRSYTVFGWFFLVSSDSISRKSTFLL